MIEYNCKLCKNQNLKGDCSLNSKPIFCQRFKLDEQFNIQERITEQMIPSILNGTDFNVKSFLNITDEDIKNNPTLGKVLLI